MLDVIESPASKGQIESSEIPPPDTRRSVKLKIASGLIISTLGDSPLPFVLEADDDAACMLQLLDS